MQHPRRFQVWQKILLPAALLALAAAGVFLLYRAEVEHKAAAEAEDVRGVVVQFGKNLQNVSTLAPKEVFGASLDEYYGQYVSNGLLNEWEADPVHAPGRQTSSPWPDRIEIGWTDKVGSVYRVHGNVIEIARSETGSTSIAAMYPVNFELEKRADRWVIVYYDRGPYTTAPAESKLRGEYLCLPERISSATSTAECVLGLKAADASGGTSYFRLDASLFESEVMTTFVPGDIVEITGIVAPIEQISSVRWQAYDIRGIIRVTNARKL